MLDCPNVDLQMHTQSHPVKRAQEELFFKILCAVVFGIANMMYFYLAMQRSFSYDESYSIGMILRDYDDIVKITSNDVHSPFYYVCLKFFCSFFGEHMYLGTKLFSWLFMLLYLISGGWIVQKHYGWKVLFFWELFSACIPSMIIQATNVRMYTMGLLFVTLSSYLAFSICRAKQSSLCRWIVFTALSVATVYVHTFCMLEMVTVYGLLLFFTYRRGEYRKSIGTLVSGGVVALCYLPWLFTLWKQFARWSGTGGDGSSHIESFGIRSVYHYLAEWFSQAENPNKIAILFGIALLGCSGYHIIRYAKETKDCMPYMGIIVAGIVFLAAVIISVLVVPCFMGRYLFPLFGSLWLFCAVGICRGSDGCSV